MYKSSKNSGFRNSEVSPVLLKLHVPPLNFNFHNSWVRTSPLFIDKTEGNTYDTKPQFQSNLEQALVSHSGDEKEEMMPGTIIPRSSISRDKQGHIMPTMNIFL